MSNSRVPPREERRFTAADQAAYERRMRGLYGSQPTGGVRKELAEPGAALELPRLPDDGTGVDPEPPGAVADDYGDQALARDGFSSRFGEDGGGDAGELPEGFVRWGSPEHIKAMADSIRHHEDKRIIADLGNIKIKQKKTGNRFQSTAPKE